MVSIYHIRRRATPDLDRQKCTAAFVISDITALLHEIRLDF